MKYEYQEYPKRVRLPDGTFARVTSEAEEAALATPAPPKNKGGRPKKEPAA